MTDKQKEILKFAMANDPDKVIKLLDIIKYGKIPFDIAFNMMFN